MNIVRIVPLLLLVGVKHYEGYIAKLCTRTLKDDAGNTYSYVDEEMRNRLQVRLITRTLAFHVG